MGPSCLPKLSADGSKLFAKVISRWVQVVYQSYQQTIKVVSISLDYLGKDEEPKQVQNCV